MSGHSKWNNIKNKKAAEDAKKGKVFGYIGRQIRVAVKEGKGGDPNANPSLRMALEKAREVNMPKANIDRAIERGLGRTKSGATIEEVVYEGYGPGGVGIMVTAITDNRNRTGAEIRTLFEHHGGSLGGPGAAAYLFDIAPDGSATVKIPLAMDNPGTVSQIENLVELLENHDDVEQVVHNMMENEE
jgi:YebC/PmpR family DNA-binding regulatory protein